MTLRNKLEELDREWMDEKERHGSVAHLEWQSIKWLLLIVAGMAIIGFGQWLWGRGLDPRLDAPGGWCNFLGACLAFGSLVFYMLSLGRLRAYNQARYRYDSRRDKLLHDIHRSSLENPKDDTGSFP